MSKKAEKTRFLVLVFEITVNKAGSFLIIVVFNHCYHIIYSSLL